MRKTILTLGAALVLCTMAPSGPAAQGPAAFDAGLFRELQWRNIGPHRASRTRALDGVPSQPHTFYIGVANGGVWKTTDAGRTWLPIFDQQPTGSIGALAVSLSDPNVIYVGSGEAAQRPDLGAGDGIYKSSDAGKTWTHLGLRDAQQIGQVVIDPKDPNRLFVAALGHPYGPNTERGIFRSTDGGKSFERVLYKDENTGGADVLLDPSNPKHRLRRRSGRHGRGRGRTATSADPNSGMFKSIDGGTTWRQLDRRLPDLGGGSRLAASASASRRAGRRDCSRSSNRGTPGLFRSDDAGETWTRVNSDPRVLARPSDATRRSRAPDQSRHRDRADDRHVEIHRRRHARSPRFAARQAATIIRRAWFNPNNPDIIAMTSDQGAVITLNSGESWSSWYNQATAAFYHVTTDNAFPYRVCSGQQESGSVCIQSRGDEGQITFREWSTGRRRRVRLRRARSARSGHRLWRQGVAVGSPDRDRCSKSVRGSAAPADYRVVRTMPVLFSPVNPRKLYFSSNMLWQTINGGRSWDQISPDLTRKTWEIPKNVGIYTSLPEAQPTQRGVIYTIAPSYLEERTIWVGTDDGLIHVTRDSGKTWHDVTPPALKPWSKVSIMDASHFDANTAYAAINTFRLDDLRPHIYRTKDGGKTWTHITAGIPDGGIINVVREDPKRRGLLFAGSEQTVYVSFDDGEHWQSLRNNLPATSIRDLVIKDDDVVIGTHGRSFYILDDITPLRQIAAATTAADVHLFTPQEAWRFRWNKNTDTPLPPDEPAGQNPPDGAIVNYFLKSPARTVSIEMLDGQGGLVRKYTSDDVAEPLVEGRNTPDYWLRPHRPLLAERRTPPVRVGSASRSARGERVLVSDCGHLREHTAHTARNAGRCPGNTPSGSTWTANRKVSR